MTQARRSLLRTSKLPPVPPPRSLSPQLSRFPRLSSQIPLRRTTSRTPKAHISAAVEKCSTKSVNVPKPKAEKKDVDENIVMGNTNVVDAGSSNIETAYTAVKICANIQKSLNPEGDIDVFALGEKKFKESTRKALSAQWPLVMPRWAPASVAEVLKKIEQAEAVEKTEVVEKMGVDAKVEPVENARRACPASMDLLGQALNNKKSKANLLAGRTSADKGSDSDDEPNPRKVIAAKKSKRNLATKTKTAAELALAKQLFGDEA